MEYPASALNTRIFDDDHMSDEEAEWITPTRAAEIMGMTLHSAVRNCGLLGVAVRGPTNRREYRRLDVIAVAQILAERPVKLSAAPVRDHFLIDPWRGQTAPPCEPEPPAAVIDRKCLQCERAFQTESRFLRLCDLCRSHIAGLPE